MVFTLGPVNLMLKPEWTENNKQKMMQENKEGERKDKPEQDENQTSRGWEERIHFFFSVVTLCRFSLNYINLSSRHLFFS